jgi:hypothetical protein
MANERNAKIGTESVDVDSIDEKGFSINGKSRKPAGIIGRNARM